MEKYKYEIANMSYKELKQLASDCKLKGRSKLNLIELSEALQNSDEALTILKERDEENDRKLAEIYKDMLDKKKELHNRDPYKHEDELTVLYPISFDELSDIRNDDYGDSNSFITKYFMFTMPDMNKQEFTVTLSSNEWKLLNCTLYRRKMEVSKSSSKSDSIKIDTIKSTKVEVNPISITDYYVYFHDYSDNVVFAIPITSDLQLFD